MIIFDEPSQPQSKVDIVAGSTTVRLPERTLSRTSSFLPDYETSQALNDGFFDKSSIRRKLVKHRIDSRFWKATLYALVVYVALTVVVGVPIIVTQLQKSRSPAPPPQLRTAWEGDSLNPGSLNAMGGILSTQNATVCDHWDIQQLEEPLISALATHSFEFSDSLIIQSNVSLIPQESLGITGNLTVDYNPDPSASDISVSVSLVSSSPDLFESTHVCFTNTKGPDRGISIYVPESLPFNDTLSFTISILFPSSSSPSALTDFATSLPSFTHYFGDLRNLSFDSVAVQANQADVVFESLNSRLLSVKNSFAKISGSFRTTESINLDNIEGDIKTDITLVWKEKEDPPILQVDTGNGRLDAHLILVASSGEGDDDDTDNTQGFSGSLRTFNAPLTLNVSYSTSTTTAPVNLCVFNNQAPTNITMDSRFTGTFDLQTKLANVQVSVPPGVLDPLGQHRPRNITYDQKANSRSRGWIGWGKRPSHWDPSQGQLQAVSSLSNVFVQFGHPP